MKTLLFLVVAAQAEAISILNFRELYESLRLSSNTGSNTKIFEYYMGIREQLPKFGKLAEYNWSVQKNIFSLAATFCDVMVETDQLEPDPAKRWAFDAVDFQSGPSGFSEEARKETIHTLAGLYWGRDLEPTEEALYQALLEAIAKEEPDTALSTQLLCLSACTAVSTAPQFWVKP